MATGIPCKGDVPCFWRFQEWLLRPEPSDRKQSDEWLKLEIKVAHIRTRETYGVRRLQTELADSGIIIGRDRLARLQWKTSGEH